MYEDIATKRQQRRHTHDIYKVLEDTSKQKYYILDMFPYPSGSGLHVGHPKGYVATDVIARNKMLQGYNVLHPMGFDAFGLPAEQYAIKNKVNPAVSTRNNIARYKEQLKMIGLCYDRSREIQTTDPSFYKRTQWTFLRIYEHYFDHQTQKAKPISELKKTLLAAGKNEEEITHILDSKRLAFVDYRPINWCPSCKTGLANEDLEDGMCERCGSQVEQKRMRQRVIRITDYAERLLAGLEELDQRPAHVKHMQKNWIGKSEGTEFTMQVADTDHHVQIYTTRIDTIYGMSYIALAPEHPLVDQITTEENRKNVQEYIEQSKKKTQLQRSDLNKDKTGICTGSYAIHPFTGEKIAIWIADYVLTDYGTGAVMAVPAHDERDREFANKYNLPVTSVIAPLFGATTEEAIFRPDKITKERDVAYAIVRNPKDDTYLILNLLTGETGQSLIVGGVEQGEDWIQACKREIYEETGYKNLYLVDSLDTHVHAKFFALHKDENRYAKAKTFVFELIDEEQDAVNSVELERHDIMWLTKDQVDIKFHNQRYMWDQYVHGFSPNTDYGILVNSGIYTGMSSADAIVAMQKDLLDKHIGGKKVQYKLQDWVFARQRYWGEPIPMIHTDNGILAVDEQHLPVELPYVEDYEPTGTTEGPLAAIEEWVNVRLDDGGSGKRETNTMPQWAGSSRYWLRYMDPHNTQNLVDPEKEKYWGPVDLYIGGMEHATRHLIYARFWHKFLYDIGVVSSSEPFTRLVGVGIVLASDGQKMSKRYGNVVNPEKVISKYGADAFRTYEMFMGPFESEVARSTDGVKGVKKFLDKIMQLSSKLMDGDDDKKIQSLLHKTIKKVSDDIEQCKFNTAISQMMILVNELSSHEKVSIDTYEKLIVLISPFAPHLAEEMWEKLGREFSIFTTGQWPSYDESLLVDETVSIAVQVNGKVRSTIQVSPQASQQEVMEIVHVQENLQIYLQNPIRKVIYIPGKILNLVVS